MNHSAIKCLFFLFFFGVVLLAPTAQTAPDRYWVQFSDKDNSPFSMAKPAAFLSDKAIAKRKKFDIPIQENDLPVNPEYINGVLDLGNIQLINKSKWFNAITIVLTDTLLLQDIMNLPFVNQIKSTIQYQAVSTVPVTKSKDFTLESSSEYGYSFPQINLHSGQLLHELGYDGTGMNVAIFDAGFNRADILPVFKHLRDDGRIVETRDFTDGAENVYSFSSHGRNVLSIMGGYQKDSLIGSAYGANYYLFITEEFSFENIIEEDNWVAAAEYADSIGIDVINTSLGYSLFDDSLQNHSYSDMDGKTTRISIAMNIAASKGIIPVTSAGNSGNSSWHYITAPGDCIDCLTVGAVDTAGTLVSFSSFGPSADGRVKPDVASVGWNTAYAAGDSSITFGSGTSYSSPLLAGLTACLWQAFPENTNLEIMQAIRESAHLFSTPNDSLGYGIPDFWKAFQYLANTNTLTGSFDVQVFPSPFATSFSLVINQVQGEENIHVSMYSMDGRLVFDQSPYFFNDGARFVKQFDDEFAYLPSGFYNLVIDIDDERYFKLVEKR